MSLMGIWRLSWCTAKGALAPSHPTIPSSQWTISSSVSYLVPSYSWVNSFYVIAVVSEELLSSLSLLLLSQVIIWHYLLRFSCLQVSQCSSGAPWAHVHMCSQAHKRYLTFLLKSGSRVYKHERNRENIKQNYKYIWFFVHVLIKLSMSFILCAWCDVVWCAHREWTRRSVPLVTAQVEPRVAVKADEC
jgi:hypothetical protein